MRWHQPEGREDILGMGTADLDFYLSALRERSCADGIVKKICLTTAISRTATMKQ